MIGIAVNKLTKLDVLVPVLRNLGKRHGGYGVQDVHYDTVGTALLKTLGAGVWARFYCGCKRSLGNVYGIMSEVMKTVGRSKV